MVLRYAVPALGLIVVAAIGLGRFALGASEPSQMWQRLRKRRGPLRKNQARSHLNMIRREIPKQPGANPDARRQSIKGSRTVFAKRCGGATNGGCRGKGRYAGTEERRGSTSGHRRGSSAAGTEAYAC